MTASIAQASATAAGGVSASTIIETSAGMVAGTSGKATSNVSGGSGSSEI